MGEIDFSKGIYVYVGSAMTNVEKRLRRHFSEVENLHWHIDYFSEKTEPLDYLILPEDGSRECFLAEAVSEVGEAVESFGSSDCDCGSHLFHVTSPRDC